MPGPLDGRLVVLTGGTSGIGREAAVALAAQGARLALVCRSPERGAATIEAVRRTTPAATVALHRADLSRQSEVRRVAAELLAAHPRIDVLVNNAGIVNTSRRLTEDGVDEVFATNHLAYFLLTLLLRDRLVASAPARVVNVASDAHKVGRIDFDDLGHARRWSVARSYGTSKLANILFTRELARRLAGTGVTVNCLHPGAVATGLAQNNGWFARGMTRVLAPFFRTPAQGADTLVWLASAPEVAHVTGGYFQDRTARTPSRAAQDDAVAARLWDASARLVGLPPGAA